MRFHPQGVTYVKEVLEKEVRTEALLSYVACRTKVRLTMSFISHKDTQE